MIYLILSVLSSSIIFVVFKMYSRYGIHTLQAIVFNYFFAFSAGLMLQEEQLSLGAVLEKERFPGVFLLGVLFITVFYLAALTTQRNGLSVVSVATKMSVVIPVSLGILLYRESIGPIKITGILLALLAVYLTTARKKEGFQIRKQNMVLPLLVFVGSGIIDSLIKYLENTHVAQQEVPIFSSSIFAVAGILGSMILLWKKVKRELGFRLKNILAGFVLGVPNFFSIYFLVLALRNDGAESSVVFPINNVGIVMLSTFLGVALFGEKMQLKNWFGIVLAVCSILLIGLS